MIRIYCRCTVGLKDPAQKRLCQNAYKSLSISHRDYKTIGDNNQYIIGYISGKPIGLIEFSPSIETTDIEVVYTMTKYRRKGVMRAMFKHLLRKNEKLVWISLLSATPAYLKIGAKIDKHSASSLSCRMSIKKGELR